MKKVFVAWAGVALALGNINPGECKAGWKRGASKVEIDVHVFRSTQSFNLPTAETLKKGLWEFEISHRFRPAISGGSIVLWGLDGPVYMRLAMGYAISDKLFATLARSNQTDNLDYRLKYRAFELRSNTLPTVVAFQAGVGWNTEVPGRDAGDSKNRQYYVQLIVNTCIHKQVVMGIVPSYLYNFAIFSADHEQTFTVGLYGQWYLSDLFSLLGEWNISEGGFYFPNDAVSLGIELGTGGHFFKILVTNSTALNPSQFLPGTDSDFSTDQWHLGFNVTRILDF